MPVNIFVGFLYNEEVTLLQVEALLTKTGNAMPGSKADKVDDHEAFLKATATLLHPSNFQVRDFYTDTH